MRFKGTWVLLACLWVGGFYGMGGQRSHAQIPQVKIENPRVGHMSKEMGYSVAIDGNTMVVGAPKSYAFQHIESGVARVYVKNGTGTWILQAELFANDCMDYDWFGYSVSISGDTIAIGAYRVDSYTGSVYVYTRSGSQWTQQAKLYASDAKAGDCFGYSVSISGDTIVAGAFQYDGWTFSIGSAYVFVRNGTIWTEQAQLMAPDSAAEDMFGGAVSLSGDMAAIGAAFNNGGSVYVFKRTNTTWVQQAKISAADGAYQDYFGGSVCLSGDTLIVGAIGDDDMGANSGSAYIYILNGATWDLQQRISAPDGASEDWFGGSVSVLGNTSIIGAPSDDGITSNTGSAYVFSRGGSVWTLQSKLTALDAANNDRFGKSVALSTDTAIVGAYYDNEASSDSGSTYVFSRLGNAWNQNQELASTNMAAGNAFGRSVSISGNTAIIGADGGGGSNPGGAFIFARNGSAWDLQASLASDATLNSDYFGNSAAVSADTAIVGAFRHNNGKGAAFVYTRNGQAWSQQAELSAPDTMSNSFFGWSVSISGDAAIIGARLEEQSAGAAYIFRCLNGVWRQEARLTAPDGSKGDDFGYSVAISGNSAVVGAALNDNYGKLGTGAAYVFVCDGSTWSQQQKLVALDASTNDQLGWCVAISGNTIVAGARLDSDINSEAGSAYVFTRRGTVWSQSQKLTAGDDAVVGDWFGYSASVSGETMVIGAAPANQRTGSSYIFKRFGSAWIQQAKLTANDAATGDMLGYSVANEGNMVIAGAPMKCDPEQGSGAAYVFDLTPLAGSPGIAAFSINNDAVSTTSETVTLNNVGSNSPTHYMASESPNFKGANWLVYSPSPTFMLSSGAGLKTVFFKLKNDNGQSIVVGDSIVVGMGVAAAKSWPVYE